MLQRFHCLRKRLKKSPKLDLVGFRRRYFSMVHERLNGRFSKSFFVKSQRAVPPGRFVYRKSVSQNRFTLPENGKQKQSTQCIFFSARKMKRFKKQKQIFMQKARLYVLFIIRNGNSFEKKTINLLKLLLTYSNLITTILKHLKMLILILLQKKKRFVLMTLVEVFRRNSAVCANRHFSRSPN